MPPKQNNEPPVAEAQQQDAQDSTSDDEAYDTSSSSADDDGDSPLNTTLFGSMRTRLRWQADSKTLHLDVRQYVQNRRKLEVKYKGRLNTHTGHYAYTAQAQRIMSQNTPSLARIIAAERGLAVESEGEEIEDTQRFLPAGLKTLIFKDWTAAPGLRVTSQGSTTPLLLPAPAAATAAEPDAAAGAVVAAGGGSGSSSGLHYCVTIRKQPQVLLRRGVWDSWLQAKADVEFDGQQQALGFRGSLRLKVLRLNLTDKQDLQLSVGADYWGAAHSSSVGSSVGSSKEGDGVEGSLTPYVKLSETSWAVRLSRGALAFTYEI